MSVHTIRTCYRPSSIARKVREGGLLRAAAWYGGFTFELVKIIVRFAATDARRRFNSEPTEQEALGLFLIGGTVGLALILIAIGNGFGYSPW